MAKPPVNIAASVRQRLLNLTRAEERDFGVVLVAYGLERLIHRLSISNHKDKFVLKGGMLVTLWTVDQNRFTRDVDFLGFGVADADALKEIFTEILSIEVEDGIRFDAAKLTAAPIREDQVYGGMRLKTKAYLEKTEIPITIDIGFGDAISAPEFSIEFPSLLDFPVSTIRAYSPATVIAEKFHAVVALGLANGRMKDFYDLWAIPQNIKIDDTDLDDAIRATFQRRKTAIPGERPDGLTDAFAEDAQKAAQWRAYAETIGLDGVELKFVAAGIWSRLGPACQRLTQSRP